VSDALQNILTKVEALQPGDSGIEADGTGFVIYAVEPGERWMTKVSMVFIKTDCEAVSITQEYPSHTTWVVDRPMRWSWAKVEVSE